MRSTGKKLMVVCLAMLLLSSTCKKSSGGEEPNNQDTFMAGFYNGQPFECIGVSFLDAGGVMNIQGVTAQGKSVLLLVNGADVGNYACGSPSQAGKAEIRCNIIGNVHETVYTECGPPPQTKYASGNVTIKAFAGHTVAGEFTATLYDDSNCGLLTKQISGSFRTIKQ